MTFLQTGSFPEYVKPQAEGAYIAPQAATQPAYTAPASTGYSTGYEQLQATPTPAAPIYQAPVTPAPQPASSQPAANGTAPTQDRPARNFGGFSF